MDGVSFEFVSTFAERGGRTVLNGVNATLADHGITVIIGPSGSGKSTLLRLCNRLVVPSSGKVLFEGSDLGDMDPLAVRREVGMVFQSPVALPGTVAENLRVADPTATDQQIEDALARVGLQGTADRSAAQLSGGEAQRMCLARALMARPRFVLFDEVTSSLDTASARAIEELAVSLAGLGTPSAWVTHDLEQMRRIAHHLVVMVDGRVIQQGDAVQVLDAPDPQTDQFLRGGDL
jgi:putative ABC transport system ATP-binding protein